MTSSEGTSEGNLASDGSSTFSDIHGDIEFDILNQITETTHSIIYRAFSTVISNAVSIKTPLEVTKETLKKYSKELEVGLKLRGCPCVIQYYGLRRYRKSLGLVMEDFHGVSLQHVFEKNEELSLTEILRIGIEIAEGIRQIHQNGVIHQNLCPQHILVNRNSNSIKLLDFSFSTVLSKQNQIVLNSKSLSHCLEWISPEQTGRMNKDVDYRTDYYTFGLLLYRLACGVVPFSFSESSKLIYAHLAKVPLPPSQMDSKIPNSFNEIILKLLAKNADDRYQSAFGIKFDLQCCLNELIQGGKTIGEFKIASQDIKSTFQICQKLYGRSKEISTLLNTFEQIEDGSINSRLILVSGYSGIGKTALINEVHKPLTKSGGFFISGKIDQFNRGVPYSSIVQAFQQLIKSILTESEQVVKEWREEMLKLLNGKGQVIVDVIPEVELIIGPQPSLVPLAPTENNNRFKATFIEFLKVFAKKEHPLVIFLDDLQWSDVSTLMMIEELVTSSQVQYLLVIGAYRDNEVNDSSPLMLIAKSIDSKSPVIHISLPRLSLEHINDLISDSLKSKETSALAQLVSEKTQGNPFFITVFLANLVESKLLEFNSRDGKWNWDSNEIRKSNITDNVVEMMTGRIKKLSDSTQRMLALAASIGNRFDLAALSAIVGKGLHALMDDLWPAVRDELLLIYGEESPLAFSNVDLRLGVQNIRFQFLHDRVQQAAYELTPVENRPQIHLSIGRVLLKTTPVDYLDDRLFDLLSHFKFGIDLIQEEEEKLKLAQLWIRAAQRAKKSTAAENGYEYASFAKQMLGRDAWEENYELTFQMYQLLVECDYLRGNYESAELLYPQILQHCRNNNDKTVVYYIKISQLEKQQRYGEQIETSRECLALHQVHIPSLKNSEEYFKEYLKEQVKLVEINLKGRKVSELHKSKEMTEEWKKGVGKIISMIWAATYCIGQKEYLALISCQAFNFFLEHGSSNTSSVVCSNFAFSWDTMGIDPKFAFDVAILGCSLLEIYPNEPLRCKTYFPFAIGISHNIMPLQYGFSFLDRGYESALECGDIPFACYIIHHIVTHRYFRGITLAEVKKVYFRTYPFLEKYNLFIWNYGIGSSHIFRWHIADHSVSEQQFISRKENQGSIINLGSFYVSLVQIQMWNNSQNWVETYRIMDLAMENIVGVTGFYSETEYLFCRCMIIMRSLSLNFLSTLSSDRQSFYLKSMEDILVYFEERARVCPSNNLHKYFILLSQKSQLNGDFFQAVLHLNKAKESAAEHQYIQYEALSNELLGRLWNEKGQRSYAKQHLEEAFHLYRSWESVSKMDHLLNDFPDHFGHLRKTTEGMDLELNVENVKAMSSPKPHFDRSSVYSTDTSSSTSGMKNGTSGNNKNEMPDNSNTNMDLQSMVKVAEAASMDMSLEQLLDSMMRLVIENAGAQKGIFLLAENNGELLVVAEGDIDKMQVDSLRAISLSSVANYPHAIINYVARTKETIIIGDATKKAPISFESSHYVQSNQVKSILCSPILKNNKFKGVIYLENNLINNAFNDHRAKIVSAISVQMAIHLDNAKFSQLLESEKRFRALATELEIVKKGLEEFIDVLCHELRNPLNGIYGSKQLMADQLDQFRNFIQEKIWDDAKTKEEVEAYISEFNDMLEAVSVSSDHLKDIVDTVLTVSMLEKQTIKLQNIPFRPLEVIEKVGLMYKAKLLEKGLKFTTNVSQEDLVVLGDPHRLTQVLINVVSNSVKFMDKGGITIHCQYDQIDENRVSLQFNVKDTGIGLTEAEITKLFKPFAQANSNIYSKYGGSGLGLKISKEMIELMGGNITLESEKGVGTSCIFHVICQKASPKEIKANRKRPASAMASPSLTSSGQSVPKPSKIAAVKNKHILVVEDNAINQKLMKRILEAEGYTTELADNGKEAFDKVRSAYGTPQQFHAILMDFEMPIMNGIESTQKIRQFEEEHGGPSRIPIIGVSANARDTHSQTAFGIGMDCYITKPFQKKDIFDAIESKPRSQSLVNNT